MRKSVFSSSHVITTPALAVATLNDYDLPLHDCDVPVPPNFLCHVRKVSPPIPFSADVANTSRSYALIKRFLHFHQKLMIASRKSDFYDCNYKYKGVSLQASFSMLIILLFHVVLNFQSTKIILAFNILSIFNLITLAYTKPYTNLSRL